MANIKEIISEVGKLDPGLARQIDKFVKEHSYGLVFEQNLPENVRLYTKMPAVGDTVNILPSRGQKENSENRLPWLVTELSGGEATVEHECETKTVQAADLVTLVNCKDVVYPGLKEIDRIERGAPSDPYHMVINAENYHALEALAYCYSGKVDCIYIDPPYNTGAKDWKYDNNYVDTNDQYRHSKWLNFMQRRLELAKLLLNPQDSVLIVTIDEKEYLRLGLLLEQTFETAANIQMISTLTNSRGVARGKGFARVDEYIYVVQFGESAVNRLPLSDEWRVNINRDQRVTHLRWSMLIRSGSHFLRKDSPNQFYPIFVYDDGKRIHSVGQSYYGKHRDEVSPPPGTFAVWPVRSDGTEGNWQISNTNLRTLISRGYVMLGRKKDGRVPVYYLKKGEIKKVESGVYQITGHREDGSILSDTEVRALVPGTQWRIGRHDASVGGTGILKTIFGDSRFPFPKSLYSTLDTIKFFVSNKPDALIIDFFAGSGTTLHAVNLLNAEDGGQRRCICVTNNEVSADEAKKFTANGLRQGDPEWEAHGIAHYTTWPRTKCSIAGVDINGAPLKGEYLGSDMPMSDGFRANAVFCELTYESAWPIRLDRAFDAIAPLLWMHAGCRGPIISRRGKRYLTTDYYGVLFDYNQASKFCDKVKNTPSIQTVYIVTDDQRRYSNICKRLPNIEVHRLYETYLKTFEICGEGSLD
ncbi:MAG: site-specific DNA-methyltransferase [Lawsonibacter sp.]|nr:site-specific DNA-methyltransferase [Lawsonibacter sp.]